jgi:hypothetical protein
MISPQLLTLGQYLAGEFENEEQAQTEPIWYVHLRLWLRPVPLFVEDSITLFAEQASVVNLDRPYRSRLWRLRQGETGAIEVWHYLFPDIRSVQGAGRDPERLRQISPELIEFLPTCTLGVMVTPDGRGGQQFIARSLSERPGQFTYEGTTYQVALGFEATALELKTYDKGIDPSTGKGIWGALMGPYQYQKREDFSGEIHRSD